MSWTSRSTVLAALGQASPALLDSLWAAADQARQAHVGHRIHLRGLVEISNHCTADCIYCGLHRSRGGLNRYRMSRDEIVAAARQAAAVGCDTVVMQSGEDPGLSRNAVTELIAAVREASGLVVTLSLGERDADDLAAWRAAGAARYLLKFETSDGSLCEHLRGDCGRGRKRLERLGILRELGYEVGSGIIVGLPGQTIESLADDLDLMARLDLDMVAIGPLIAGDWFSEADSQTHPPIVAAETACRMVALARLHCPRANIPATTALKVVAGESGQAAALARGANVVMINVTPQPYRAQYEVYPGKGVGLDPTAAADQVRRVAVSLGRTI